MRKIKTAIDIALALLGALATVWPAKKPRKK